jgi:hypothetical protein
MSPEPRIPTPDSWGVSKNRIDSFASSGCSMIWLFVTRTIAAITGSFYVMAMSMKSLKIVILIFASF